MNDRRETIQISVDHDVHEFLKAHAIPFEDTPNSVLRRLLLADSVTQAFDNLQMLSTSRVSTSRHRAETQQFVRRVLDQSFGGEFTRKRPYQFMFETANQLVYFQNYNKSSAKLWYRLNRGAMKELRSTDKEAIVCFTNPADRIYYAIPVKDIDERARTIDYDKPDMEVNIDQDTARWSNFDWHIGRYLMRVEPQGETEESGSFQS